MDENKPDWMTNGPTFDGDDIGSSSQFIGNFIDESQNVVVQNRIWITSDTHFHHKNILVYEAKNRPFANRDEMDAELVKRWNERVRDTDVVIHLGDFAFAGASFINDIAHRLNGRKILLLGNHDRERKFDWEHLGFDMVLKRPFLMDGRFIFSHEPLAEIPEGKVNIYGHVHGSDYFRTLENNRFCVCVERHNCAPIEYEFIKNLYNPTSPAIIEA
jgi:Predicted phosphoesterase or phosphohydrolase